MRNEWNYANEAHIYAYKRGRLWQENTEKNQRAKYEKIGCVKKVRRGRSNAVKKAYERVAALIWVACSCVCASEHIFQRFHVPMPQISFRCMCYDTEGRMKIECIQWMNGKEEEDVAAYTTLRQKKGSVWCDVPIRWFAVIILHIFVFTIIKKTYFFWRARVKHAPIVIWENEKAKKMKKMNANSTTRTR